VKNNRLLLVGGAGFIGSHIARIFLTNDWQIGIVDGLVEGTGGARQNVKDFASKLEFALYQSIEETADLIEHVKWADCIVDAMAFTGHMVGFEKPLMDAGSNLLSHLRLIEALKSCPGKKIIYLGTRSQYGSVPADVITEESICLPVDPQGINKLAAEHFFRIYAKPYQFSAASLRITNCFGPNQRVNGERGLVGGFIHDVLNDKPIEIFGSAERRKNLLFGEDAARVVLEMAQKSWAGFNVFNVGGTEVSIQDLLKTIFQAAGKGNFSVKEFPEHVKRIDVGEATFSDEKLKRFLNGKKQTPLATAIGLTVEYFKQNQPRT
jgi:UDP-glucose 4-epimerase